MPSLDGQARWAGELEGQVVLSFSGITSTTVQIRTGRWYSVYWRS